MLVLFLSLVADGGVTAAMVNNRYGSEVVVKGRGLSEAIDMPLGSLRRRRPRGILNFHNGSKASDSWDVVTEGGWKEGKVG